MGGSSFFGPGLLFGIVYVLKQEKGGLAQHFRPETPQKTTCRCSFNAAKQERGSGAISTGGCRAIGRVFGAFGGRN